MMRLANTSFKQFRLNLSRHRSGKKCREFNTENIHSILSGTHISNISKLSDTRKFMAK